MIKNIPPVTRTLAIVIAVGFLAQMVAGPTLTQLFALWPLSNGFMPWQLLTYGLLHMSFMHLFFNGLALVMFGAQLEYTWGSQRYLTFIAVTTLGSGLCWLLVSALLGSGSPAMGTSGTLFGMLLAYGMLFPNQQVMMLIPPIPMKARTLVIVYGVLALVFAGSGLQSPVVVIAHLGGMLFAWLLIRYWRGQPPFGRGGKGGGKKPPTLRRVV